MKKFVFIFTAIFLLSKAKSNAQEVAVINMHNDSIHTCLAHFFDGGGESASYSNNANDTLTIFPLDQLNDKICVTFHSFNTQSANDFLYIYDGPNTQAPLINILSGSVNYGTIKSTAADGSLTFRFQSDALTNADGWNATISTDTVPEEITMMTGNTYFNSTFHVSTGKFFDNGGASQNYTGNMAESSLTLYPTNSGDKLSITFETVDITAGDFLYIFNGSVLGVNQIAALTGHNIGTVNSTAPDGSLTFKFQSGGGAPSAGWIASISVNNTPEDITTIADGVFTVSKGRFFDNGGPSVDYTNGKDAKVTLLPQNTLDKVSVTFHEFSLSSGDYLQVFNGSTVNASALLATLTGVNYGTVRSSAADGALTFVFHSDLGNTSWGWDASIATDAFIPEDITMIANGAFTVGKFSRFFDNGGSYSDYGANQNVITTVIPANASDKLTATFHLFAVQAGDTLFAYNGNDTNQVLLGSYSGTLSKFEVTSTAANGSITFKFKSNAGSFNYGWFASLVTTASLPVYNMAINQTVIDTTDGGYFYDSGGANNIYQPNETSIITFIPATPLTKISVSFNFFYTSDPNDYLEVRDGPTAFSPLIAKLYNRAAYGTISATTASGALTLKFVSNGTYNADGWAAYVSTSSAPKIFSLPGTFILPTGTTAFYYDESGPQGNYSDGKDFSTTIKPQNSSDKITVSFSYFFSADVNDYLEVHDGDDITDPIIATFHTEAGYGTISATSMNTSGCLTFRFVTNGAYQSAGWAAVASTDTTHRNISLPGTYYASSGFFTDAGGPYNDYVQLTDYRVTINPINNGEKLSVTFTYLYTSDINDYLEVHDGSSITDPLLAILHSADGYGTITASPANLTGGLTFRFVSNGAYQNAGWVGVISTQISHKNFSLPGTYTLPAGTTGYFYDAGGPEFNYVELMNSITTIMPANGNDKITASFNYFNAIGAYDSLEIYDGSDTTAARIGTYGGSTNPGTIRAFNSDGSLTFRFVTNGAYQEKGWAAAITADDCYFNTVGTEEHHPENVELSVSPNPSSGRYSLRTVDARIEKATVYTILGEKVFETGNVDSNKITIDLSLQVPGFYLLKVETQNGSIIQKVVKQ